MALEVISAMNARPNRFKLSGLKAYAASALMLLAWLLTAQAQASSEYDAKCDADAEEARKACTTTDVDGESQGLLDQAREKDDSIPNGVGSGSERNADVGTMASRYKNRRDNADALSKLSLAKAKSCRASFGKCQISCGIASGTHDNSIELLARIGLQGELSRETSLKQTISQKASTCGGYSANAAAAFQQGLMLANNRSINESGMQGTSKGDGEKSEGAVSDGSLSTAGFSASSSSAGSAQASAQARQPQSDGGFATSSRSLAAGGGFSPGDATGGASTANADRAGAGGIGGARVGSETAGGGAGMVAGGGASQGGVRAGGGRNAASITGASGKACAGCGNQARLNGIGGMSIQSVDGITGPLGPSLFQKVSAQYRRQAAGMIPEGLERKPEPNRTIEQEN